MPGWILLGGVIRLRSLRRIVNSRFKLRRRDYAGISTAAVNVSDEAALRQAGAETLSALHELPVLLGLS
jgi:hypothetical protein